MIVLGIWLIIDFCIDLITEQYDISSYNIIKGLGGFVLLLGCVLAMIW